MQISLEQLVHFNKIDSTVHQAIQISQITLTALTRMIETNL